MVGNRMGFLCAPFFIIPFSFLSKRQYGKNPVGPDLSLQSPTTCNLTLKQVIMFNSIMSFQVAKSPLHDSIGLKSNHTHPKIVLLLVVYVLGSMLWLLEC